MVKAVGAVFVGMFKPGQTLGGVVGREVITWVVAMVLLSVVYMAGAVLTLPAQQALSQKMVEAELVRMEKGEGVYKNSQMPPEARDQMKADMKRSAKDGTPVAFIVAGGAGEAVATWVGAALSALVLVGLVKLFRGNITYKGALALIGLAFMPFLVGEIVKIAGALATGTISMSPGLSSLIAPKDGAPSAALMSGPGYALASMTLSRIDFFVIWSLVVLGAGAYALTGLSRAKAALLALSYWVAAWALAALPTAIGAFFMSSVTGGTSVTSGP